MLSRRQLANAIRALSMDAVQKANSGHPGMPMGMADIAEVLWNDFLKHDPSNPQWVDRDRFILSNGHGSMLHYSLLHLTGYDLSLEELKNFRQLHSKTPGHPELGYTPGVETTTGPLGQGLANAVGMALAERTLAAQFNRPDHTIVDHYTYVFLGDGCLMEGISHEACSLAGTLGLGKLIGFWDNNGISIDGKVSGWFTDNTPQRFAAYGWQVVADVDGHDTAAVYDAIIKARAEKDRPTLICCQTTIAFGAPNLAGTAKAHGAPLGETEIAAAREKLKWPYAPFVIPPEIYQAWDARKKGAQFAADWHKRFVAYQKQYPDLAAEFSRRMRGELPKHWLTQTKHWIATSQQKAETIASRKASQNTLNAYAAMLPELIGGSADLTESNLTIWKEAQVNTRNHPAGNYIYYGVREFAMSAVMNGIAAHKGFIPFGGTFLTFTDYARNAIRMAALMKIGVIFVYTHDSVGLGEDGPTHQPIEHIAMLRMTPQLSVWRPCDATETAVAWQCAIAQRQQPTCLLFSRQNIPHQIRDEQTVANITRGGYILQDCVGEPQAIIIATGSEVALAVAAQEILTAQNQRVRVVSMPSTDVFLQQEPAYQEQVLPVRITARVAVEAAVKDYWYKFVGLNGKVVGLDRYGESAPATAVFKVRGITVENVVAAVQSTLIRR